MGRSARRLLCWLELHHWDYEFIRLGFHHERCAWCGKRRTLLWRSLGGRS